MANTVTATATYTRFNLLIMQVRSLVKETVDPDMETMETLTAGLKPPHYIKQVKALGLYPDGKMGARITLSVDWEMHSINVAAGSPTMSAPSSWKDGVSPGISEAAWFFRDAVKEAGLRTELRWSYGSQFNIEEVHRILGTKTVTPAVWKNPPEGGSIELERLNEINIRVESAI